MTIEELIECDAQKLASMSDEELLKHFEKYLPVTRPEHAPKKQNIQKQFMATNPKLAQAAAIAGNLGIKIDLGLLSGIKKKK